MHICVYVYKLWKGTQISVAVVACLGCGETYSKGGQSRKTVDCILCFLIWEPCKYASFFKRNCNKQAMEEMSLFFPDNHCSMCLVHPFGGIYIFVCTKF